MLYYNDDPRPEIQVEDGTELGGLFAGHIIRAVADGDPDLAEQTWLNAQAVDGGRHTVAALANIAANAIQEMVTMMRCSGQYEHVPTVGDLRRRYRFNHEATAQIRKMTEGESK
jgi:hypothetical protein